MINTILRIYRYLLELYTQPRKVESNLEDLRKNIYTLDYMY